MFEDTERKRIERCLEDSEAKYQELVQNVNSVILKMDSEGKITFFNKFAQTFFDYTEKEILGRYVVGTIVPETGSDGLDLGFMIKDIEINPDKYINNENENMRRNGELVWVAWTNKAIRDVTGKVTEILCIGNDITERKRMENELKDYEERFRRLFETAKDGLLLIDKGSGNIVNVNPAIVEMLGHSSEEFIGKKLKDIGLFKDIKDFKETIGELIQAGFINYENVSAETKQGRLINVDIHLVDRARFIQCNVRDITERMKTEAELEKYRLHLEEMVRDRTAELKLEIDHRIMIDDELKQHRKQLRNMYIKHQSKWEEERSAIATEIHDELGQIMAAARMNVAWMKMEYPDHKGIIEKSSEIIGLIDAAIKSIRRICTELRPDLLDHLGVGAAIQWQAAEFSKKSGIPCKVTIEEDIPGDNDCRIALFRIFQEALANIIRHAEATKVEINLRSEGGEVILEIGDNGKGITEEDKSKPGAFGLLGMLERVYPWSGMVYIKGNPDRGTTIEVILPVGHRKN